MTLTEKYLSENDNILILRPDSIKLIDSIPPQINIDDTVPHNLKEDLIEYKFEKKILESWRIDPNYNLKWG